MNMPKQEGRSQLFTLRVWPEKIGEDTTEWRGKVQRVADGQTLYFRDWSVLLNFVLERPGVNLEQREEPPRVKQ
jgi:hypothetical protein